MKQLNQQMMFYDTNFRFGNLGSHHQPKSNISIGDLGLWHPLSFKDYSK